MAREAGMWSATQNFLTPESMWTMKQPGCSHPKVLPPFRLEQSHCFTNRHHHPTPPRTENTTARATSSSFADTNKKSPEHAHPPLFSHVLFLSSLLCACTTFQDIVSSMLGRWLTYRKQDAYSKTRRLFELLEMVAPPKPH